MDLKLNLRLHRIAILVALDSQLLRHNRLKRERLGQSARYSGPSCLQHIGKPTKLELN